MKRTPRVAWRFIVAVGFGLWNASTAFGDVAANNCAQFTATSRSYLHVASSEALKLNHPMTLEVWVKPTAGGGEWALVFGKQNNPSDANPWYSYRFYANSANSSQKGFPRTVAFTVAKAGGYETGLGSTNLVPVDVWTHIAGVYDGQTMTVYINGLPESSMPMTSDMRTSDLGLYIGKASWTNYNNYNGQMDEIRIWNVARTPAQIQTWMNLSLPEDAPGLVAYWPFNDTPGSPTAADATSNNHVATLYNGAAIVGNATSPVNPAVQCVFQTDGTAGALVNGEAVHVRVLPKGGSCAEVTAVAPAGYSFAGWSGGCTGAMNPLTIPAVETDLAVTAHFTPIAVVGDGMTPWGPPGPTMHTLEDIYQKQLETQQRVGVMASPKTLSDATVVVEAGYYPATTLDAVDADLAAGNIVAGVNLFGVAGSAIQAAGNALPEQVLAGATFSKAGETGLTGTLPNRGAVDFTPGTADQTIPQGYHSGQGLVMGDADLVAGNLRKGATLFGVAGTFEGSRVPVFATGQTNSFFQGNTLTLASDSGKQIGLLSELHGSGTSRVVANTAGNPAKYNLDFTGTAVVNAGVMKCVSGGFVAADEVVINRGGIYEIGSGTAYDPSPGQRLTTNRVVFCGGQINEGGQPLKGASVDQIVGDVVNTLVLTSGCSRLQMTAPPSTSGTFLRAKELFRAQGALLVVAADKLGANLDTTNRGQQFQVDSGVVGIGGGGAEGTTTMLTKISLQP